jgi:EF hand
MRSIERLLVRALTAALLLTGAAVAQAPDQKADSAPQLFRQPPLPAGLGVDDVVARLMAFDKNKDGRITKDELPERMQFLIDLGDSNKDGALDRDEIKKLATTRATSRRGFGPDFAPRGIGGVVDDLKLSGKKKDRAMAAVTAHEEKVRKLTEEARAELLRKMKEILNEDEWKDFKAALDRPTGGSTVILGPDATRRLDAERRIDQLPKEPRDLRREPQR